MDKKLLNKIEELKKLTDEECNCDTEIPWKRCRGCDAARTLMDAGNIIENEYKRLIENYEH